MLNIDELYRQVKRLTPLLLKTYAAVFTLLLAFVYFHIFQNIDIGEFTRDPIQILGGQPYQGILSNLGILFWTATVSTTFLTSYLMQQDLQQPVAARFLFFSGAFTAFLMLDDLFLLHDRVFPDILDIPEFLIYLVYGFILVIYFVQFYATILEGEYIILLLSIAFLGGSLLIDIADHFYKIPALFLFEDGFKFLGIVSWFLYFIRKNISYLRKAGVKQEDEKVQQ